jgi:hypothetical protein
MLIHSWFNGLSGAQEKRRLRSSRHVFHRTLAAVNNTFAKPTIPFVEALEDRMAPALFLSPIVTGTGGLNPPAVAVTDFNNDGLFDVAVVNNRTNNATLSVLFGKGNGQFTQGPIFAIGNSATSVAVGDFNGDGKADIAVADPADNTIAFFFGNNDGTFSTPVADLMTGPPTVIAASDFNEDHVTDLAVGMSNGQVWWVHNTNTGFVNSFIDSAHGPVSAIAAGDLNNDGHQDIVAASQTRLVSDWLGNGKGSFTLAPGSPNSLTATIATGIALGNFRGITGRQDLVIANGSDNTVTLMLANGNGSFAAPTTLAVAGQPTGIVARDFDLDGNVDFVTTNPANNTITARLGKGDGTFKAGVNFSAGSVPTGIAIGDFNNDQKPDVVVADFGNQVTGVGSAVSVLLNGSAGLSYMLTGPSTGVAGTSFQFTVTVKNFKGATDTAYRGTIHFTSSDGFAVLPADYAFTSVDSGVHTFTATLNSSGQQTLTGTDTSDATITGSLTITISNPVPVITSLGQNSAVEGSGNLSIRVMGTGFSATSVVQWNGTGLTTSFLDNSDLQAIIPAADLADEGTASITIFNPTPGGGTSNSTTFTISDADLSASGTAVTTTEGLAFSGQVATFTDANPSASLSDFATAGAVMIDWGDGTPQSAGNVVQPGGVGTAFIVRGSHTYAEEGSKSISVVITDEGGATTTANTTATIADAPLAISVAPIKVIPGIAFSGQVATFVDGNKGAPLSDFNGLGGATINWGDGTTNAGVVSQPGGVGTTFIVSGTHTYATGDNHIFKVTITDVGGSTVKGQALAGDFQPHDIAGRIASNGQWWVGLSNGSDAFGNSLWATWNPAVNWVDVQTGDFNGDGRADIIGRDAGSGAWWVGLSNGANGFTTTMWAAWNPNITWVDVHVGDFNGDGKDDIVGRVLQTGQWWVGISDGSHFTTTLWATWSPAVTWIDVRVGDFNGDHSADIAGRVQQNGQWWVGTSNGTSFNTSLWTAWSTAVNWVDVQVSDFNGDGKADLAGRVAQNGQWWVATSNGSAFINNLWGAWSPAVTWVDVKVGDFNGDGFSDIIGRVQQTGQWWVAISNGSNTFNSFLWAIWNPSVNWVDVQVGDFNADGRDDITGRASSTGQWWTSLSQGSTSTTSLWTTWNSAVHWVDVHSAVFVPV